MRESIFTDPPVTPFVECPNCRRLLDYGVARCPDCYEEIRADYAMLSGAVVVINTKACASANTIKTLDVTAFIALGVFLFEMFGQDLPALPLIPLCWPLLAWLAIVVWFIRFGRFRLGDDDFLRARRQMLLRLLAWPLFMVGLWSFYFLMVPANRVAH